MKDKYKKLFLDSLKNAENIVLTTHLFPDADGIGSQISLCLALREYGKQAICVNEEPLLERYRYLDPDQVVISYDDYQKLKQKKEIDLFIVVDTNSLPRIGPRAKELVQKSAEMLFIDHHPAPKELKAIHCIDTSMAATGELVGTLIEAMKIKMTAKLALPLYTSILIDTSSFRYPTVTGHTHRLIATLMDAGIKPPEAYNFIYGTKKITYMHLLGTILSMAQINKNETIAWLTLKEKNLNHFNVDSEDTHAFINHLLILNNIKIACMFRENGNSVKISLRSAGDVDVGVFAQALGGGGHNHSAATILEGKLDHVVPYTINKLEKMLNNIDEAD